MRPADAGAMTPAVSVPRRSGMAENFEIVWQVSHAMVLSARFKDRPQEYRIPIGECVPRYITTSTTIATTCDATFM